MKLKCNYSSCQGKEARNKKIKIFMLIAGFLLPRTTDRTVIPLFFVRYFGENTKPRQTHPQMLAGYIPCARH